jgi:uncharacterized membrane protein
MRLAALRGFKEASKETITKSVVVNVPCSTAYNQYSQCEDFPQFMQGMKSIRQIDDNAMQWNAEVGGKDVQWASKLIEQVPDQVIVWESTSGKPNHGRAVFKPQGGDSTLIEVTMRYEPEGVLENVGDALGFVTSRLEGDLQRLKHFVEKRGQETGAWRSEVHGGSTTS